MSSFAIVVPNLNQSHFLWSAFESLRHQSAPFQLAVMDGGSRDNFREVVRDYADIISYLESGPDGGQAAAIKTGTERISGDVVAWLNADDYYFPGALDEVASCFESNPEVDVIYGDAIHVSPECCFISYFPPIQEFNADDLLRGCFICQPACFVRRSVYEAIGGIDGSLQYTMDWDLWCRLSLGGAKFKYMRKVLAAVRYYPETKTLSGGWERCKEIYRIERKYGERLFPATALAAYRYSLTLKSTNTFRDRMLLVLLNLMRFFKRRFRKFGDSRAGPCGTIYGFNRWEPVVEKRCTIHLAWYDEREWRRLLLKVEPAEVEYRIEINGRVCKSTLSEEGYLAVEVQGLKEPGRRIMIESLISDRWKLVEFHCDIAQE